MATFMLYPNVVSSTPFQTLHHTNKKCPNSDSFLSLCAPSSPAEAKIQFSGLGFVSNTSSSRKRKLVVARAGPPSTTTLIFAFVFPLSLLLVTIFTSIRIADKLDQQYLEEVDQTPPSHFHFSSIHHNSNWVLVGFPQIAFEKILSIDLFSISTFYALVVISLFDRNDARHMFVKLLVITHGICNRVTRKNQFGFCLEFLKLH